MNTNRRDEDLINQIHILDSSAVGVIMIKTNEPYRALDILQNLAETNSMKLDFWNSGFGWETRFHPQQNNCSGNSEMMIDPVKAIKSIIDAPEEEFTSLYVMLHPHKFVEKSPQIQSMVKHISRTFTQSEAKRVFIICPPSFDLPCELNDDIVEITLDLPSFDELKEVYLSIIENLVKKFQPSFSEDEQNFIVSSLQGMTYHEASTTVSRAFIANHEKLPNITVSDILTEIHKIKTEIVRSSGCLDILEPVELEQVGGKTLLKDWVKKRRETFTDDAKNFGISNPKGVALVGPPGTGKSLLGKAIGGELGLPLIKFDLQMVFDSLIGNSEKNTKQALKMIESMSPCTVLFDEVDKALGGSHSSGNDSGVSQRVLGIILSWLQETKEQVFCIFTMNRVENLPSELFRKGRMDEVFSVGLSSGEERREIFKIHLDMRNWNAESFDLDKVVEATNGFSGAEIENIVKDALIEAFNSKKDLTSNELLNQALNTIPLSVSHKEQFTQMNEWAKNNARPSQTNDDLKEEPKKVATKNKRQLRME